MRQNRILMRPCTAITTTLLATLLTIWQATAAETASVPFSFSDNRMMIQCMIDDAGPFTMVVDTGSSDVVIDTLVANRLGLKVRNSGTVSGAGNKQAQIGETELRSLSIGARDFENLPASVLDLSEIRTKLGFARLDGIVGYAVMKRFAVLVDVDSSTISLLASQPNIPRSATKTAFSGVIPIIHATIDGIPTTVVIDTGDRSSLTLFGPFAKLHGLYGKYPSQPNIVTGYGLGGPVYGDVFSLPSLDVFGAQLNAVVTRASRQTGGAFTSSQQGGSVGEGVLKRFNIVYDYQNNQIIAWPSKFFASPDRFVPPPGSENLTPAPPTPAGSTG